jgi:hypothetical protein
MNPKKDRIEANAELVKQVPNCNSKTTSYRSVVNELHELKMLISELGNLIKPMQNQH